MSGSVTAKSFALSGYLYVTAIVKPSAGKVLTLLKNTGGAAISGAFFGKAEGSTFAVNGVTYKISYKGGSGHDVTLTAQ